MPRIAPNSYWHSTDGKRAVRVLAFDAPDGGHGPGRVMYESVPGGRVFSTWEDRFLARFELAAKRTLQDIQKEMSAAQREGRHVTLCPADLRTLLRVIKSEGIRTLLREVKNANTVSTSEVQ